MQGIEEINSKFQANLWYFEGPRVSVILFAALTTPSVRGGFTRRYHRSERVVNTQVR